LFSAGFSLLELVVVVAILGVLSAVALPSLLGNTEKAKVVAAKQAIASAILECGLAIDDGYTKEDLTFPYAGGALNSDLVPTLFSKISGYRFDTTKGGCHGMYLVPDSPNTPGDNPSGYPTLQAKPASQVLV
jgi:prepilin-type N-terminal cleavage/methylation domain-containing protein